MATQQEKAYCLLPFEVPKSIVTLRREFRVRFQKEVTHENNIRRWYRQFVVSGCLCKGKSSGRPRVPRADVERVRETYQRSPKKSLRRESRELQMPTTTLWSVLRKRILMKPYKLQLLQALKPQDKVARTHFAEDIQEKMEDDGFVERLVSIDDATFHLSTIVNRHNDGAPPYFHSIVRGLLNLVLPQRWIGRAAGEHSPLLRWPPLSPDITPCDLFLWGYVKNLVYVPPLPKSLQDLRNRINRAVETITPEMLQRVWQEFDYRIDECRVTKGTHMEAL
ncbi:hypothetical protein B7P43_G11719 [Cryptotermes secundus]|uniref:DUF4817 domain-containing protein n=1 Tax=Cryptotermes secundus TaxID=105785 RepID=A0A2J7PUB2_9NEOP|nr:hypothetical protein B7P43_G11719 [Cryptotermes secundus]